MQWREVIEHPSLKDLPFKIETNEWGKIVMTPASGTHVLYQGIIIKWFNRLAEQGITTPECPIETSRGTKVADVAWGSAEFFRKHGAIILSFPQCPEIVVEVISPSNSSAEMDEKRALYFEAGAKEFWLCNEYGDMRFFNPEGELERSEIFGKFPGHIDITLS
ncbi:MAG: Uma2 family endonuclease [Syntrophobacteraceae bacterium]